MNAYCSALLELLKEQREQPSPDQELIRALEARLTAYMEARGVPREGHPGSSLPERLESLPEEVVFLPWRAEQWGSLADFYRMEAGAGAEDPAPEGSGLTEGVRRKVYVIPLPYYRKNPDGTFLELYYEGDDFPEGLPVTGYEEYDFENRHPDRIYFQNPFDAENYVFSVPPYFYSENLRELTEELIYVPPYETDPILPQDESAMQTRRYFIQAPGVRNADKVYVRTEEDKRAYLEALAEECGNDLRDALEGAVLVRGKEVREALPPPELPEGWRDVWNASGSESRKVLLYFVSVASFAEYGSAALRKMRESLALFREHSGELALIWRPDPAAERLLPSLAPELWTEYDAIRREYREAGYGIYDDTDDIVRAVLLSDAFYGDAGAELRECRRRGLPVMLQSVEVQGC